MIKPNGRNWRPTSRDVLPHPEQIPVEFSTDRYIIRDIYIYTRRYVRFYFFPVTVTTGKFRGRSTITTYDYYAFHGINGPRGTGRAERGSPG